MSGPEGLPPGYLGYLEERDNQRLEAVEEALGAMTERERGLVREAAVMGYVRGAMFGRYAGEGAEHPKDTAVLVEVLDSVQAFPDLYPHMAALRTGEL